jgi:3-oxoacyl-[acyl-carrier-protein] synthase-1
VFGDTMPPFSSTKSLTGHSLGATGVQEAIYCLIMLQQGLHRRLGQRRNARPAAEGMPLVRKTRDAHSHRAVQQLRLWRHQRQPGLF